MAPTEDEPLQHRHLSGRYEVKIDAVRVGSLLCPFPHL